MSAVEPPKRIYTLESTVEFATMEQRDQYARALRTLENEHGIEVKHRGYRYRFTHCRKCGRAYHLGNGIMPGESKNQCSLAWSASCIAIAEEKAKGL